MNKIQMPWPFACEADPSVPMTLNAPSEEGRQLGEHLARFYVTEKCATGAADERCRDCAFRLGSIPNGCLQTVGDAIKCLMEGEEFACHHGDRICAGYALLARDGK